MISHVDARQYVLAAFKAQFNRDATLTEAQCLQAIGWLETNYGASWHGPGVGSFNMGAIQQGAWKGAVFTYTDTHPLPDGTSKPYTIGFRKYPDAVSGFADLCRVVYCAFATRAEALACAGRGDLLGFSTALHKYPCYYEGFGATDAIRIAHHCAAVRSAIALMSAAIGEPAPYTTSHIPAPVVPALLLGCTGPAVSAWQAVVGVKQDGVFGGATQTATRAWQTSHNLPETGVVCAPELIAAGLQVAA